MKRKRCHAMTMTFKLVCGTRGGNVTSLISGPKDRRFWSIVTCKRCLALRNSV